MNGHVNYFQDMPNVPQNVNSKKHSPHVILKQRMTQKKRVSVAAQLTCLTDLPPTI